MQFDLEYLFPIYHFFLIISISVQLLAISAMKFDEIIRIQMYTYNKILTEQSSYKIKHYRVINNNRNRILFEEI